jgi:hypothetical protein
MCPIGAHFKRIRMAEPDDPDRFRKDSSIMRTKVLSIMPVKAAAVTVD